MDLGGVGWVGGFTGGGRGGMMDGVRMCRLDLGLEHFTEVTEWVLWLDLSSGGSFAGWVGNSFSGKVGGEMYNLDLVKVNRGLVKAILIIAAARRMVGKKSEVYEDLQNAEREVREAGAECQRVLKLVEIDDGRMLLTGGSV